MTLTVSVRQKKGTDASFPLLEAIREGERRGTGSSAFNDHLGAEKVYAFFHEKKKEEQRMIVCSKNASGILEFSCEQYTIFTESVLFLV